MKLHRNDYEYFELDSYAKDKGIHVVRQPPYHCIFNMIENVWGEAKHKIRYQNKTQKLSDVQKLIKEVFDAIPKEHFANYQKKVQSEEEFFWRTDCLQENVIERIVIENSSDDEESDDDNSYTSTDETRYDNYTVANMDISGIAAFTD